MSMRKFLACGIAAMALNPLAVAIAQADEYCEAGKGCGLQGPRGGMEDESLVQRRPFTPGGLPVLPHNAERELPREQLILWQREGALGERDQMLSLGEETIDTVLLRDGLPVVRFASGRSAVPDEDSEALDKLVQRLAGKRNLRLRLVGHTDPQRLSPRTRGIYGDNQGLGMQRAKEVGALFMQRLNLNPDQLRFDSRGPSEPLVEGDSQQAWRSIVGSRWRSGTTNPSSVRPPSRWNVPPAVWLKRAWRRSA